MCSSGTQRNEVYIDNSAVDYACKATLHPCLIKLRIQLQCLGRCGSLCRCKIMEYMMIAPTWLRIVVVDVFEPLSHQDTVSIQTYRLTKVESRSSHMLNGIFSDGKTTSFLDLDTYSCKYYCCTFPCFVELDVLLNMPWDASINA